MPGLKGATEKTAGDDSEPSHAGRDRPVQNVMAYGIGCCNDTGVPKSGEEKYSTARNRKDGSFCSGEQGV